MQLALKGGLSIELPFDQSKIDEWTLAEAQSVLSRIALLPENEQEDMKLAVSLGLYLAQQASNGGRAKLSQIKAGRTKGQWHFSLKGANGEPVEPTNERYHNRLDAMATLAKYFSNFEVVCNQ